MKQSSTPTRSSPAKAGMLQQRSSPITTDGAKKPPSSAAAVSSQVRRRWTSHPQPHPCTPLTHEDLTERRQASPHPIGRLRVVMTQAAQQQVTEGRGKYEEDGVPVTYQGGMKAGKRHGKGVLRDQTGKVR